MVSKPLVSPFTFTTDDPWLSFQVFKGIEEIRICVLIHKTSKNSGTPRPQDLNMASRKSIQKSFKTSFQGSLLLSPPWWPLHRGGRWKITPVTTLVCAVNPSSSSWRQGPKHIQPWQQWQPAPSSAFVAPGNSSRATFEPPQPAAGSKINKSRVWWINREPRGMPEGRPRKTGHWNS
jgi:hypothetical protein